MSMLVRSATTGGASVYIEDVFSTYLYTGTGSTQTITNGIDLSGKGGLVWIKRRNGIDNHRWFDTDRGNLVHLSSSSTSGNIATASDSVTSFNADGFSLGADSGNWVNFSGSIYASWTFRKQAKFFDVVTYTGNGSNRTIAHNLGSVPGCIIVKRTDTTGDWQVYHRANTANPETDYLVLNTTAATADSDTRWNDTLPTSTVFSLGTDATVNANGGTYVAYLFAHDTDTDGIIQCGSFTTDASGVYGNVTLGWEPQFVLTKNTTGTGQHWVIHDFMRSSLTTSSILSPSQAATESSVSGENLYPNATGFSGDSINQAATQIYLAIRRPNKPPTTGTQVFMPTVYTGTNVDNRLVDTTIAPDMVWVRQRNDTVLGGMVVGDRLRGQPYLLTGTTAAEVNDADAFDQQIVSTVEYGTAFSAMNGFWCGNDATAKLNANTTSNNHIVEAFKRAPGFFDVVCYTGDGTLSKTINHNLRAVPQIVIVKSRSVSGTRWHCNIYNLVNATKAVFLEQSAADVTSTTAWDSYYPTATEFKVGKGATSDTNDSGATYVAYLFATLPGISKVGTYTGNGGTAGTNGTSQTINCGFSAGSRFVLIKRTDSTGDWYVFDSARGIVAGSDPYLLTNSTAAEVTTVDAVDTDNSGFVVNQTSGTDLNVTSATYIFLAIA